ncbi:MAG: glutathione S-transferase family protein [Gammaproteobacteria bacterium]|nr:glutathione S-transferase family protein [Gammaproteobacteria bacterium]
MEVDLRGGETRTPAFRTKNPSGKIPVLELEDGTCLAESVAICRYLEALVPEPNLFGATPLETAQIEAVHRQLELELFAHIGAAWVNGPIVAAAGLVKPIEAQRARGEALAHQFYDRLESTLTEQPYMAGDRFTVADISALCLIEFAGALVKLAPKPELTAIAPSPRNSRRGCPYGSARRRNPRAFPSPRARRWRHRPR